jgi:RimJ/RimL family protein N-acetyltransferase
MLRTPFQSHHDRHLADELVLLRPWTRSDRAELLVAYQDLDVPPSWSGPRRVPLGPDAADQFLARTRRGWRGGDQASFAITRRRDGALLGHISLWAYAPDAAQFGFWLKRSARNQGHLARSLALIMAWATSEVGLRRLRIITRSVNTGTQAAALRAGFTPAGTSSLVRGGIRYPYLVFERGF